MPIAPAIPFGGLAGLRLLDRTHDRQFATFLSSPDLQREIDYFLEKADAVRSVDDLMGDRRLLKVVLGAYGLDDDIGKGAFIRKVLEEGTIDPKAFANRLVEPAYREMSAAVGFGDLGGLLHLDVAQKRIVERYRERQYELNVGDRDLNLRLAMNFRREAAKIAADGGSDRTIWLKLLGSRPLRSVIEGALRLPGSFASVDLDQQLAVLAERGEAILGSAGPSALADPAMREMFVERFLLSSDVTGARSGAAARGTTALTLLQTVGLGAGGATGLFASGFL